MATASGDSTVKIWDFAKAECILTFTDHIHAVWGCSWHSCGDFLATSSMDCTGKIWDVNRYFKTFLRYMNYCIHINLALQKSCKREIAFKQYCVFIFISKSAEASQGN